MRWALAALLLAAYSTLATPPVIPIAKAVPAVSSETKCFAWVTWNEARGEPLKGQRAVLDVVLTRMRKRGMTACQVVRERGQFQGYHPGVIRSLPKEALTRLEALRIIQPVAANCEFFHATYVHPAWSLKMRRCKQVGNHIFFKLRRHNEPV